MEPMSVVDIYLPDELERRQIWETIASEHPSVRSLDMAMLTKVSRNLSRTDIVTAAREAVEDAYRAGLKARAAISPITRGAHVRAFRTSSRSIPPSTVRSKTP